MVGSVDVKALYPSLLKAECARIVREMIEETEMEMSGVNYKEVVRGISMLADKDQIKSWGLKGFCPEITGARGPRPGMADVSKSHLKLKKPTKEPKNRREKMKLVGKFVELVVIEVFSNHIYEYGGKIYLQGEGGPIGLSLSGAISRVVMAVWDRKVGELCSLNGVKMWFQARYVDDRMEQWNHGEEDGDGMEKKWNGELSGRRKMRKVMRRWM